MSGTCVVTATTNPRRALACMRSWMPIPLIMVVNGMGEVQMNVPDDLAVRVIVSGQYLGTVPAFNLGVQAAIEDGYDIICALHDDLEILDSDWATKVLTHFKRHPECGLAGFGGAIGLGDADIYQKPYEPKQLARIGFRSNLRDAEVHGIRSLLPEKAAVLDGFSQIGRRGFFLGQGLTPNLANARDPNVYGGLRQWPAPWQYMEDLGLVHHFQDGALACLAKRLGWDTWYLPIACHHFGGRTAVGDSGYNEWAKSVIPGGDHGFWERAHERGYEEFRDVLPLRV